MQNSSFRSLTYFNPNVWFKYVHIYWFDCFYISFLLCFSFQNVAEEKKTKLFKITKSAVLRIFFLILTGILYGHSLRDKFLEVTSLLKTHISITRLSWAPMSQVKLNSTINYLLNKLLWQSLLSKIRHLSLPRFGFCPLCCSHSWTRCLRT